MTHVESLDLDATLQGDIVPLAPPTPQERLQASRLALQRWVDKTYHHRDVPEPANAGASQDPHEPGWLNILADSLTDVPAATIALRWVKRWWRHHPWRATADIASIAGRELARPLALKHPWLLLGGAVVAGGVLARLRPWRWVSGGALLAGFLPRFSLTSILHTVTSTLSSLHPESPAGADDHIDAPHGETDLPQQEPIAA